MTDRSKEIVRAALIFMRSNLDDINEAFKKSPPLGIGHPTDTNDGPFECDGSVDYGLRVDGVEIATIQEFEIDEALKGC